MRNADKPINPVVSSAGFATSFENIDGDGAIGLTKREYFAGLAMQGLCAVNNKGSFLSYDEFHSRFAELSVSMADALLKELESKKQ